MTRLKNKTPKAVFFDFDGVLVESATIKTDAFFDLFKIHKDHIDEIMAYHRAHAGISRFVKIRHIQENILGHPVSENEVNRLADKFSQIVKTKVVSAPWVEGAVELLEALKGKCRLFVVSGTPGEELAEIINARNAAHFFLEIHGSPQTKADITAFLLNKYNLNPAECLFVGDALTDFQAAQTCNIEFVARITDENARLFENFTGLKVFSLKELHANLNGDL